MERWLGRGSATPSPTVVIELDGTVVGWVDADTEPEWLGTGEVNIGYAVFAAHRGHGHAAAAVRLLLDALSAGRVRRALFVIDRRNQASLRVAAAVGARRIEHPATALFPTSDVYAVDLVKPRRARPGT